jgi:arsenite methyltransferase
MSSENIKSAVKEKYGAAAKRAASRQGTACCGTSPSSAIEGCDPITSDLYGASEVGSVPEAALRASLGCGNPTALAKLEPGETVLDLGSGGGIDVLLSARRVGPTGKAYGLDTTDKMLAFLGSSVRPAVPKLQLSYCTNKSSTINSFLAVIRKIQSLARMDSRV